MTLCGQAVVEHLLQNGVCEPLSRAVDATLEPQTQICPGKKQGKTQNTASAKGIMPVSSFIVPEPQAVVQASNSRGINKRDRIADPIDTSLSPSKLLEWVDLRPFC